MRRITTALGLTASLFAWLATDSLKPGPSSWTPKDEILPVILLIPADFNGWVCTDFGVSGAPALPREGNAIVITALTGEVKKTSTSGDHVSIFPKIFTVINGRRQPVPHEVDVRSQITVTSPDRTGMRVCMFIGTIDDADAAGDPPGIRDSMSNAKPIPEEERKALLSLYHATGGDHWIHRVGWLGPPGTECKWHGVTCRVGVDDQQTVVGLSLDGDNLVGSLPQEFGAVKNLEELWLFGNHLSGRLPEGLIQRWLDDSLWVSAEASLLTNVTVIQYESEILYPHFGYDRITLRSDGSAVSLAEHSHSGPTAGRTNSCEMKEGEVMPEMFAKLAWLIEKNEFYDLKSDYRRGFTDSVQEVTRVTRDGKTYSVSHYAASGPLRLWTIERAIEGAASSVYWKNTKTIPKCPEIELPH